MSGTLSPDYNPLAGHFARIMEEHASGLAEKIRICQKTMDRLSVSDHIQERRVFSPITALVEAANQAGISVRHQISGKIDLYFEPTEPAAILWSQLSMNPDEHSKQYIEIVAVHHYETGEVVRYQIHDALANTPKSAVLRPSSYGLTSDGLIAWVEQLARRLAVHMEYARHKKQSVPRRWGEIDPAFSRIYEKKY